MAGGKTSSIQNGGCGGESGEESAVGGTVGLGEGGDSGPAEVGAVSADEAVTRLGLLGTRGEEAPWLLSGLGWGGVTGRRALWEGVSVGGLGFCRPGRDVGRTDCWRKNHFGAGVAGTQAVAAREAGSQD